MSLSDTASNCKRIGNNNHRFSTRSICSVLSDSGKRIDVWAVCNLPLLALSTSMWANLPMVVFEPLAAEAGWYLGFLGDVDIAAVKSQLALPLFLLAGSTAR
jgi:hypothetical protein